MLNLNTDYLEDKIKRSKKLPFKLSKFEWQVTYESLKNFKNNLERMQTDENDGRRVADIIYESIEGAMNAIVKKFNKKGLSVDNILGFGNDKPIKVKLGLGESTSVLLALDLALTVAIMAGKEEDSMMDLAYSLEVIPTLTNMIDKIGEQSGVDHGVPLSAVMRALKAFTITKNA